jgi:hypothetical protein
MSARRDEDLEDLLAELEGTLDALRGELREERGDRRDREGTDRRGRPAPRPPSVGEVIRFTDEYTIPTVITVLETTISALELLRGLLRLADPSRSAFDGRDGARTAASSVNRVGQSALASVEDALDDLGRALSAADLPDEPESRSILEEARELSAEIEARIADAEGVRRGVGRRDREGERTGDPGRGRDRRERRDRRRGEESAAVTIEVDEEGRPDDAGRDPEDGRQGEADRRVPDDDAGDDDDGVDVDVEAELDSIREEVRGRSGDDATGGEDADGAGGTEGADAGSTDADGTGDRDAE